MPEHGLLLVASEVPPPLEAEPLALLLLPPYTADVPADAPCIFPMDDPL